jgi:large subunit ribosomal protein L30
MTAEKTTAEKTTAEKTTGKKKAGKAAHSGGTLQLKYVRSVICTPVKHKRVVRGLGFTRLNQVIERPDTQAIRGMVAKVPHLVEIV